MYLFCLYIVFFSRHYGNLIYLSINSILELVKNMN